MPKQGEIARRPAWPKDTAFGIEVTSRYGQAQELIELLDFAESAARKGLNIRAILTRRSKRVPGVVRKLATLRGQRLRPQRMFGDEVVKSEGNYSERLRDTWRRRITNL